MQPHQESYDSFNRWMITRMRANMASAREPAALHRFFAGLKTCVHCYGENCMDRKFVECNGVVKEVCQGGGWNYIGHSRADYENLWLVLAAMNTLVTDKL